MKWYQRRYQNPDGTRTELGKKHYKTAFVSGSSKTQTEGSPYYRKKLPRAVRKELNSSMRHLHKIVVGDAPGVDRQVQDYIKSKGYKDVEVYGPGKGPVRYSADKSWKTHSIDSKHPEGSPEWLAVKDKVMSELADYGLAVVLEKGGAKATRKNVDRLLEKYKDVKVYELDSKGHNKKVNPEKTTLSQMRDRTKSAWKNRGAALDTYNNAKGSNFISKSMNMQKEGMALINSYPGKTYFGKAKNAQKDLYRLLDSGKPYTQWTDKEKLLYTLAAASNSQHHHPY